MIDRRDTSVNGDRPSRRTATTDRSNWALVGLAGLVALELLVARLLLFSLGHRTTARVLAVVTPSPAWVVRGDPDPELVAETVEAVSWRLPFYTTCLTDALVCKAMLDASGFDTDLQIGVAKSGEALEAHAWLVHRGEVVIGATGEDPDRFRRITERFEP